MSVSDTPVQRHVFPKDSGILLDEDGLLDKERYSKLIELSDLTRGQSGILLAEGGMGKTIYMEQLASAINHQPVKMFKLGEYAGRVEKLEEDVEAFLREAADSPGRALIFDGLDEVSVPAWGFVSTILRLCRTFPPNTFVWISSRHIEAIPELAKELGLRIYNLAPLARSDLTSLAEQRDLAGEGFLAAASRQGLLPICAKPIGCDLALSMFSENNLEGITQRELWQRGIERLCDENPSHTRALVGASGSDSQQTVKCASWIALCLSLTGNRFVWTGTGSRKPEQCPTLEDLERTDIGIPAELIRTTLQRGVFSPLGDRRVTLSHALYGDYLAAVGLTKFEFLPRKHWDALLFNDQRDAILPQREGIAVWVTAHDNEFLERLSAVQPELLLSSADSIKAIGPGRLCASLLGRAGDLGYRQIVQLENLERLQSEGTLGALRNCLQDERSSPASITLASKIAWKCEYPQLARIFAERVLNPHLDLPQRVEAGYALLLLGDEDAKKLLKPLLPVDPSDDPNDELRGIILSACWPKHLTASELVGHLTLPQRSSFLGSYWSFLDNLERSLHSIGDKDTALELLQWAISHLGREDPYETLGDLARSVYAFCWQWAENPQVAKLLAEGYRTTLSNSFISPFEKGRVNAGMLITEDSFPSNQERRFRVLEEILQDGSLDQYDVTQFVSPSFPLYTEEDLPLLFDRVSTSPTAPLAQRWVMCVKAALGRVAKEKLEEYRGQIEELHTQFPDLVDSPEEVITQIREAISHADKWNKKRKNKEKKWAKKMAKEQKHVTTGIKNALASIDLRPEAFAGLSLRLYWRDRMQEIKSLDIRLSPGWKRLTEEEQHGMIDLAERYLREGEILKTGLNSFIYSVAFALTALRHERPDTYTSLPKDVWQKCAVELLKTGAGGGNRELLDPLFDTLADQFPDVATSALLEVMSQDPKHRAAYVIDKWGSRLTDDQAEAMLQMVRPASDPGLFCMLSWAFVRRDRGQIVQGHLDRLFNDGWRSQDGPAFHELRLLALILNTPRYLGQLLDTISDDPIWGKEWFEAVMLRYRSEFNRTFPVSAAFDIARLYIWLHEQYPADTEPDRDGAYTPTALDELHGLKSYILDYLSKSGAPGSSEALQKVLTQFPEDFWLKDCIIEARRAEQADAPPLDIAALRVLSKGGDGLNLVNSGQDLLELVMAKLQEYQQELRGGGDVRYLWEGTSKRRLPREEEDFSDHLARFLKRELAPGAAINRNVEISRRQAVGGVPGEKPDILIQAISEEGPTVALCIEVKGNWNREAKTALKVQLVDRYLSTLSSSGDDVAGIFLLGWFECPDWDPADNRKQEAQRLWDSMESAKALLEGQASTENGRHGEVRAVVIDCTLR